MGTRRRSTPLACAVALALSSGAAIAAGPVGTMPFDGDGSGAGFTIDNAGFDPNDVDAAPCPVGATCTNMTATTDNVFLMREVDTGAQRYIQAIFSDLGGGEGDFVYESVVSSQGSGDSNQTATKYTIDQDQGGGNTFNTGVAMYRGSVFGAINANNTIAVEMTQNVNGFQTMEMETRQAPNIGASLFRQGRFHIQQAGGGGMQEFGHTQVAGAFQTVAGTLTAGSESITFLAGQAVSATWIGGQMFGGGPGVILAPGQTQNHDTRTAAQRDFGLLVYRTRNAADSLGQGNSGGQANGLLEPQFTQLPDNQVARGFSGPDPSQQDSGLMYNIEHGAFIGGADILANGWDATVFGPNPY